MRRFLEIPGSTLTLTAGYHQVRDFRQFLQVNT
jgi:hypothetical protein